MKKHDWRNIAIRLLTVFWERGVLQRLRVDWIGGWVSKSTRNRWRQVAVVAVFILPVVIFVLVGDARPSSGSHAQKRLVQAVDRTLREGTHAKLPPHLSTLLGMSAEEECPVMQRVVRTGQVVQGFDVSTANKNDVVVFVVNEVTNDQALYLTSAAGTLRKMVAVEAGVGKVRRITNQDRKAFEKEKQFWLDRLSPAP